MPRSRITDKFSSVTMVPVLSFFVLVCHLPNLTDSALSIIEPGQKKTTWNKFFTAMTWLAIFYRKEAFFFRSIITLRLRSVDSLSLWHTLMELFQGQYDLESIQETILSQYQKAITTFLVSKCSVLTFVKAPLGTTCHVTTDQPGDYLMLMFDAPYQDKLCYYGTFNAFQSPVATTEGHRRLRNARPRVRGPRGVQQNASIRHSADQDNVKSECAMLTITDDRVTDVYFSVRHSVT